MKRAESMLWRRLCRKGTALEKRFLQAASEMLEIPSAKAAAARILKERPEQAYKKGSLKGPKQNGHPFSAGMRLFLPQAYPDFQEGMEEFYYPRFLNVLVEAGPFWYH